MTEITYRTENGIQIPNFELPENPTEPIGKYGMMRRKHLMQNRRSLYSAMMIRGTLLSHLAEIDKTAREQVEQMIQQMAKAEGITEKLKAENPMKWAGLMNNLRHSAEEVVLQQLVLS
ncbi:MAG: TnpV protein [Ruminococcaceae bacterium]|nr:TnpV protein [Oscillospiraceae bacterium]